MENTRTNGEGGQVGKEVGARLCLTHKANPSIADRKLEYVDHYEFEMTVILGQKPNYLPKDLPFKTPGT